MPKKSSWLSIDSRLPHDPKLSLLPSNNHRWTWVCLLCLEKRGELEGQDVLGFAHYCHIDTLEFAEILESLRSIGLLTDENRPVDFAEWQRRAQTKERKVRFLERSGTQTERKRNAKERKGTQKERSGTKMEPSYTYTDTYTDNKNLPENPGRREDIGFSESARKAEALLEQLILGNDPKARIPKTEAQRAKWIDQIDKLNRLDGRGWEEIERVMRWAQNDHFWKSNILSAQKFRAQFPKLMLAGEKKTSMDAAQSVIRRLSID